ncbi:aldo/keto reductase [Aerococcaceae bacterium DSM 111176]|nr:aldo/keto reductase [Aerococcaceae bacterium DSM 111176]
MFNKILNNDYEMPIVGSGTNTFGKVDNAYSNPLRGDSLEVDWAIENGYRHFDTAQSYFNEKVLGDGIAKSDVPRSEFFITTKLSTWEGYPSDEWARAEIEKSLELLQTDYIDQFLIHKPWGNDEELVQAWAVLEDYYNRGVFKSIGVSNFSVDELKVILENGTVRPAANQIESHLGKWQDDLIEFHNSENIATVAWGPLRNIGEAPEALKAIAEKYGKTVAQVVLRYQIQRGVVVIPKSHNKDRQAQSLDIFDFELTEEEANQISEM